MEIGLKHSAKGTTWTKKNHKYIAKKNNRYYYSLKKSGKSSIGDSFKNLKEVHDQAQAEKKKQKQENEKALKAWGELVRSNPAYLTGYTLALGILLHISNKKIKELGL